MSFASAKAYGKPPPESFQRVDQTQAFDKVDAYDTRGYKTLLITDGAPAYKKLKKKYKLLLAQCNHAKGIFSYTKNIGVRKKLKVHTGGVDGFWNIMKKGVPKSLPSKSTKKIWMYLQSAHWRWENSTTNLLEKTGKFVSKLWNGKRKKRSKNDENT